MELPEWWSPLGREIPKIDATSRPGKVRFSCKLTGEPPDEWIQLFMNPQVETDFPPDSMRIAGSPGLGGFSITGECAEEYLEKCIANIDGRIQSANTKYEQVVIPKIIEDAERAREKSEAQRKRIEDLQRRADQL